jgi:hypothetical protein
MFSSLVRNTVLPLFLSFSARATLELEEIVRKHESLVQKLREECCNLMRQLEKASQKYK